MKTCIRIEACKTESSERHNRREKELAYVRSDRTHLNESWEIATVSDRMAAIKETYKKSTGQNMQRKATPIREGVIVISPSTTMADLRQLATNIEDQWGIKTIQIHIHRDEGHTYHGLWKPNLHAHLVFDWTQDNGKSIKLNRKDMSELQTICAKTLHMERGVSSDKKHLSAIQYKTEAKNRELESLEKEYVERQEDWEQKCNRLENQRNNLAREVDNLEIKVKELEKVKVELKELEKINIPITEKLNIHRKEIQKSAADFWNGRTAARERQIKELQEQLAAASNQIDSLQEECAAIKEQYIEALNTNNQHSKILRDALRWNLDLKQYSTVLKGGKAIIDSVTDSNQRKITPKTGGIMITNQGDRLVGKCVGINNMSYDNFCLAAITSLQSCFDFDFGGCGDLSTTSRKRKRSDDENEDRGRGRGI